MQFFDLTHTITTDMPVYPGTTPPQITEASRITRDGYREKSLNFYSHTGTHIDAPAHLFEYGHTLDTVPVDQFFGKAIVLDASHHPGRDIELADLSLTNANAEVDFVIFYTGWYHKWGTTAFFTDFPVPSIKTAKYLAELSIKGVGTDAISIDPAGATDFYLHKILLQNNILILENLTNLAGLVDQIFTLCCWPLKIAEADGAPVRAVAICD